jgi:hypothetical protein
MPGAPGVVAVGGTLATRGISCHQVRVSPSGMAPPEALSTTTRFTLLVKGNSWLNSVVVRRLLQLHRPPGPQLPATPAGSPLAGGSRSSATIFLKPWKPRPSTLSMASSYR